jgi:hypothetical protein
MNDVDRIIILFILFFFDLVKVSKLVAKELLTARRSKLHVYLAPDRLAALYYP